MVWVKLPNEKYNLYRMCLVTTEGLPGQYTARFNNSKYHCQFHDTLEEARQEGEELAVEVRKLRQLEQMNQSLQESLGLRVSNAQRSANLHTSPSMGPKAEKAPYFCSAAPLTQW